MSGPSRDDVALLLSEGLDLCVRARKLDADVAKAAAFSGGTRCLTPALWVQDQYDRDLAEWEARGRAALGRLPLFAAPATTTTGD